MSCYCYTCAREIGSLGIASHRAAHRRRNEDCRIMLSGGAIYTYAFSLKKKKRNKK